MLRECCGNVAGMLQVCCGHVFPADDLNIVRILKKKTSDLSEKSYPRFFGLPGPDPG